MKRLRSWSFALGVVLVCISIRAAQAHARVLANFDDLPAVTSVFNQYDGVTFPCGDSSNPAGPNVQIIQPPLGAISGDRALQLYRPDCEFCPARIVMVFTQPQQH